MIEFMNPSGKIVVLTGPNKERVEFTKFQRKSLPDWYKRYSPKYIKIVRYIKDNESPPKPPEKPKESNNKVMGKKTKTSMMAAAQDRLKQANERQQRKRHLSRSRNIAKAAARNQTRPKSKKRKIVGSTNMRKDSANEHYQQIIKKLKYPISNDIGIGILSYNRLDCIRRLVKSIRKHTNLNKTTVFISDESDDKAVRNFLRGIEDMVVLLNDRRLGVAGNTNRLMRCLSRFSYKIILNDDVEILNSGWENVYANAMKETEIHHFLYRQPGVYGAKPDDGTTRSVRDIKVRTIHDKPQGAVMAYDSVAFEKAGFFDERFEIYGMEHVDWSNRVSLSKIQPNGYHDVVGSNHFFRVHPDKSAVQNRSRHLGANRKKFESLRNKKDRVYVKPSSKSEVPEVTYIIPFRGQDRANAIELVALNIKAQLYPGIEIIMVEQDDVKRLHKTPCFRSIKYLFAKSWKSNQPFTKALAFNLGVSKASNDKLILHDADMIVHGTYTDYMSKLLYQHNGVHIGKNVVYMSRAASEKICNNKVIMPGMRVERAVGYYEGGSLGCKRKTYINVGGFDERFVGYGCFCPGNYVLTHVGYKAIEDVLSSDLVYTHEGIFRPVELRNRRYCGQVLDVYVPGRLPIKGVTPDHPFMVRSGQQWEWRRADELSEGDQLLDTDFLPELVDPYDLREIMRLDRSKNSFNLFDNMGQFCYLLGLYIAEGVLQSPDRLRTIYLFLNEDEVFLAEHVEQVVKQLNDDINVTYHYVKNNCRDVRIFNSLLAKLIFAVAGKNNARNKVLSYNFLQGLSDEHIGLLLGGMCDGDANHSRGSAKRVIYHTSSINMAMLASGLMRKVGIAHSFGKRSGGSFEGSSRWSFDLCVNREFEHKLKMIYPKADLVGSSAMGHSSFGKVYEVRQRPYDGVVYNFEVYEDHSYIVNGLVAHNCEDTEFFSRLSSVDKFFNERSISLIHLWHRRTPGWEAWHTKNKEIEKRTYAVPMGERISRQKARLLNKYKF